MTQPWSPYVEAICLTAVTGDGVDVPTLVRRLGHDPERLQPLQPVEAWELQDGEDGWRDVVTFVAAGPGRVLLVEENGWQGADRRVLELLSAPGACAVSAYWNVNWTNRFSVAADGVLLGSLEYLDLDSADAPSSLAEDIRVIRQVAGDAPDGWKAGFLAGLEARAGFGVDAGWWQQEHPTLVVDGLLPPQPRPPR